MALLGGHEQEGLPPGLVWLARLAGGIHLTRGRENHFSDIFSVPPLPYWGSGIQPKSWDAARRVSKAFFDLMPESAFNSNGELSADVPGSRELGCIHRVARNRSVELAVNKSASAIKADAARRLFDISCSDITWAVIDSGIDTRHNAFMDHNIRGGCRVDAVYDFTILRELNDLDLVVAALTNPPGSRLFSELVRRQVNPLNDAEVIRILTAHRDRLQAGDDVDYNLIEPLLRDFNPARPALAHGTHVAGILGADWRDGDASKITGVCPDIRLIDMRIVRSDGRSDEFEVISALEFLRHHNDRSGRLAIHGANLSFSIHHNLRGDACGRTPVCVECERAVNAGVCIVTVAGNRGTVEIQSIIDYEWRGMEIYLDSSITDPGNADAVITVGATHRNRPHEYGVSFFSSRGPTGDGRKKPDLVAPGEKIEGPAPGQNMDESDGTSMAAPHISGAAALIMARHAELIGRPGQIKKILCETATDLKREPNFQGAGLVDVLRALQSI